MLGQRRRRWPDITAALGHRLVFAGNINKKHVLIHCSISDNITRDRRRARSASNVNGAVIEYLTHLVGL